MVLRALHRRVQRFNNFVHVSTRNLIREYQLRYATGEHILVYQMAKVGSSSVSWSLANQGYPRVYHFHKANPETLRHRPLSPNERTGYKVYQHVIVPHKPIKVISLVRDPLARNISAFFQTLGKRSLPTNPTLLDDQSALQKLFFETYHHRIGIDWFDKQFLPVLGINVYDYPFDHEHGYVRIQHENIDAIIIKLEIDDQQKQQIIREFLHDDKFILHRVNESETKSYSEAYKRFKQNLNPSPEYLDELYTSRMATHFYTPQEIAQFRQKWVKTPIV